MEMFAYLLEIEGTYETVLSNMNISGWPAMQSITCVASIFEFTKPMTITKLGLRSLEVVASSSSILHKRRCLIFYDLRCQNIGVNDGW